MPILFDSDGLGAILRGLGAAMGGAAADAADPAQQTPRAGLDPALAGPLDDADRGVAEQYRTVEDDTATGLRGIDEVLAADDAGRDGLSGIDGPQAPAGGASQSVDHAAMQQAMLEQNVAQQQMQQQAMYQQMLNQQQQAAWQQAMAQQQYAAQMAQMNMAAQQQAMAQAAQTPSLSTDEIASIIADLYADEDNWVDGYDDGSGESSRRTLAAADVDALDPSEVSLEKVAGGEMSEQELRAVINEAADLNGISDDPEIRERFINVWSQMSAHESGHNPNAANGWDSNAVGEIWEDGYPAQSSRGPWQTIPDTFANNHVAGTSTSIYDPLASAAASIRYTMQRYDVGPNGENLDAFAAARGIDPDSGEMVGGYVGY